MASVIPTVLGASPDSKPLQSESGYSTIPDKSALLEEERIPIPQKRENIDNTASVHAPEREMETSKVDEERSKPMPVPMPSPAAEPEIVTSVPVALFGKHVEMKHGNNNQPFITEFSVGSDQHSR